MRQVPPSNETAPELTVTSLSVPTGRFPALRLVVGDVSFPANPQDFCLASISMMISTSSPIGPKKVLMPKSERFRVLRAEKPA